MCHHTTKIAELPGTVVLSGIRIEDLLPHTCAGQPDGVLGLRVGGEVRETGDGLPILGAPQPGEDVPPGVIGVDPGDIAHIEMLRAATT